MKPFSSTPEEKSVVVDFSAKATESEDIGVENGLKSQSYNHTNTDVMSKKQDTTSVEPAVGDFWNLSEVHSWTDEKLNQNLTVLLEEKKRRDLNRTWKIQMSEIHKAQVQAQVQAQTALLPQQSMIAGGQIAPELTVYDHYKYHHQQHIQPLSFAQQNGKLAEGKGIVPPTGNGGLQHPLGNTPIAAPPQVGFSGSNIGTKMTPLTSQSQLSGYHEFGADVLKALDSTSTPKITHMLTPNFMKTEGALLVSKPEGGKPKRKPLRPGFTASNRERQFVNHDYQDHYMEEPSNHEANLDMFYETKATIDGPATVKPIESVQRLAFPLKLHLGLTAIEDAGLTHIISWQPHGRAVLIHKPKEFEDEVMETYFAMKKLTSFQRQLNLYGFRRITCGADAGSYYHELFLRGKAFLCRRMQRIKIKGNGFKAAAKPECEPDFYKMIPCRDPMRPHEGNGVKIVNATKPASNGQKRDSVAAATALLSFSTPSAPNESAEEKENPNMKDAPSVLIKGECVV